MKGPVTVMLIVALAACSRAGVGPTTVEPVRPRQTRPTPPVSAPLPTVQAPPSSGFTQPRRFDEVRGLWVVRTTLQTPEGIRAMVASAADGGFNTLIVQVRGRGDAFYQSRWEPRAEGLAPTDPAFDPLALTIVEAHARGLAVHAWVNTNLIWSGEDLPTDPDHVVNAHPDWLAVPRPLAKELFAVDPTEPHFVQALRGYATDNRDSVEGIYTSPAHPAVRARVLDVWLDLAERYDLDGIHFDYVRYPSLVFDYSRGALDRFRAWVAPRLDTARLASLDGAYRRDPFAFTDSLPSAWDEFRRAQITGMVESIYYAVKARRPDLLVSAAVFPNIEDARSNRFQEWPRWLRQGILDVAVPMAYTDDLQAFQKYVGEAVRVAGGKQRVWAGVGIFVTDLDGALAQIEVARRAGTAGVVLFSYDWARDSGGMVAGSPFLRAVGRLGFGR
jgi:uncharacterized lipoprotein YddW (UPF0748 family)